MEMEEIVRDNGDHEEVWRSRAEETRYHSSSKGLKARTGSNKAGYTATPVACGWAGAMFEVTLSFGQEQ